jgi:hypothetical protein
MKRTILAMLAGLVALSPAVAQLPNNQRPAGPLPVLPLTDQFDRPFAPMAYHGNVLVLLHGDRASTDSNKILGDYLYASFHPAARGLPAGPAHQQPVRPLPDAVPGAPSPDVQVMTVASYGRVPGASQGLIRGQVKLLSPEVPVLLDFGDAMKNTFGQVERVPNLLIVDRAGNIRHTASGPFTPDQVTQVTMLIENLRREPVGKH